MTSLKRQSKRRTRSLMQPYSHTVNRGWFASQALLATGTDGSERLVMSACEPGSFSDGYGRFREVGHVRAAK